MTQGTSDRRQAVRFEVVGELWGTLATTMSVRLRNISQGGLLVESRQALPAGLAYQIRVLARDGTVVIPVRVCHVLPIGRAGEPDHYLVGLEFIHVPSTADEWLTELMQSRSRIGKGQDDAPEADG